MPEPDANVGQAGFGSSRDGLLGARLERQMLKRRREKGPIALLSDEKVHSLRNTQFEGCADRRGQTARADDSLRREKCASELLMNFPDGKRGVIKLSLEQAGVELESSSLTS